MSDSVRIADRVFNSRLFVGTGKYRSFQEMARCHVASESEVVTVAVRRVNLTDKSKESLLDYIDREKMFILPNTAACYTADEAIRTARLGREVGDDEADDDPAAEAQPPDAADGHAGEDDDHEPAVADGSTAMGGWTTEGS